MQADSAAITDRVGDLHRAASRLLVSHLLNCVCPSAVCKVFETVQLLRVAVAERLELVHEILIAIGRSTVAECHHVVALGVLR